MAALNPYKKFLVPALLAFLAPAGLPAAVLGAVKVESEGGKAVLKVVSTGKVSPAVSSEAGKVIIDVKGGERSSVETLAVGRLGVKQVRFGQKKGSYRIVVDMESGLGAGARLLESSEGGFSVVLGNAGPAKAASQEAAAPSVEKEEAASDLAPMAAGLTYRVVDISYGSAGDKVQVVISTDGPVNYKTAVKEGGKLLRLTLRNASLSWAAPSEDAGKAPVRAITARQSVKAGETQVSVDIALSEKAPYSLSREQNQVVVSFDKPVAAASERKGPGNIDMPVTLEVEQADLVGVIKSLAVQAGFEVDFSKEIVNLAPEMRTVTFSANKRPLRDVLGSMLAPVQMSYDVQGDLMYVGKPADIKVKKQSMKKVLKEYNPRYMLASQLTELMKMSLKGDDTIDPAEAIQVDPRDKTRLIFGNNEGDVSKLLALARKLDAPEDGVELAGEAKGSGNRKTQVFKLNYLDATAETLITDSIAQIVPPEEIADKSFVSRFDAQRRILVATGKVKHLEQVAKLLTRIDVRQSQVHIEGKIVEVSQEDAKAMGITLNFDNNINSLDGVAGLVNAVPSRGGVGILSVVNTQNLMQINAQIDALVQNSAADIISSPSITIRDNHQATINIADKVITQSLKRDTTGSTITDTVTFAEKNIPLELKVTPRISLEDLTVVMNIDFTLDSITGEPSQTGAPPPTSSQTTHTEVTVANSETAVIGGLMRDSLTKASDKVPILGDIPLLGLLFRRELTVKKKKEIIIFITPKIEEL